jgi:hypothetical protein
MQQGTMNLVEQEIKIACLRPAEPEQIRALMASLDQDTRASMETNRVPRNNWLDPPLCNVLNDLARLVKLKLISWMLSYSPDVPSDHASTVLVSSVFLLEIGMFKS